MDEIIKISAKVMLLTFMIAAVTAAMYFILGDTFNYTLFVFLLVGYLLLISQTVRYMLEELKEHLISRKKVGYLINTQVENEI